VSGDSFLFTAEVGKAFLHICYMKFVLQMVKRHGNNEVKLSNMSGIPRTELMVFFCAEGEEMLLKFDMTGPRTAYSMLMNTILQDEPPHSLVR
jgi:hypothetical protein